LLKFSCIVVDVGVGRVLKGKNVSGSRMPNGSIVSLWNSMVKNKFVSGVYRSDSDLGLSGGFLISTNAIHIAMSRAFIVI
jgi:hypothetical protein